MTVRQLALLLAACATAACAKSPLGPAGAVSVTAPAPIFPPNGARLADAAQPITLTIRNAATTDSGVAVVYTFEVAGDRAFGFKILTRDVAQTPNETSVRLDALASNQQYFWRVRPVAGDTLGPFTEPLSFTVTSASATALIDAPTPLFPPAGSTVASTRPTLTIVNSARTGAVGGAVSYWFEIATDAGFANIATRGAAAEGSAQTSFTPASALSFTTTYYWHARAIDTADGAVSAFSTTSTFVTVSGS